MLNDIASIEKIEEEKIHREISRIGSRLFDIWVYLSFTLGIITEGFGLGYLIYCYTR